MQDYHLSAGEILVCTEQSEYILFALEYAFRRMHKAEPRLLCTTCAFILYSMYIKIRFSEIPVFGLCPASGCLAAAAAAVACLPPLMSSGGEMDNVKRLSSPSTSRPDAYQHTIRTYIIAFIFYAYVQQLRVHQPHARDNILVCHFSHFLVDCWTRARVAVFLRSFFVVIKRFVSVRGRVSSFFLGVWRMHC